MSLSTFSPSSSRKRSSDTPVAAGICTTTSSNTRLRVRIKKFHGVAKWTWNVGNGSDDEVCGICQSAFEGCPPGVKFPGDESPVVFGTCGESFSFVREEIFFVSILWLSLSRNPLIFPLPNFRSRLSPAMRCYLAQFQQADVPDLSCGLGIWKFW